jgi:hypothetical protein
MDQLKFIASSATGALRLLVIAVSASSLAHSQTTGCQTPAPGLPCILTSQYDIARDAYNGNETVLTPLAVKSSKMSTTPIYQFNVDTEDLPDGAVSNPVLAQPLYVAQVAGVGNPPAKHNLLIAVTLNGTVFAWDADDKPCNNGTARERAIPW